MKQLQTLDWKLFQTVYNMNQHTEMVKICDVIDFDGFMLREKIFISEAGFVKIRTQFYELCDPTFVNFNKTQLPCTAYGLSEIEKNNIMWTTWNIHRWPFSTDIRENHTKPVSDLKEIIWCWYHDIKSTFGDSIADKDGHHEKDVLDIKYYEYKLEGFSIPQSSRADE